MLQLLVSGRSCGLNRGGVFSSPGGIVPLSHSGLPLSGLPSILVFCVTWASLMALRMVLGGGSPSSVTLPLIVAQPLPSRAVSFASASPSSSLSPLPPPSLPPDLATFVVPLLPPPQPVASGIVQASSAATH